MIGITDQVCDLLRRYGVNSSRADIESRLRLLKKWGVPEGEAARSTVVFRAKMDGGIDLDPIALVGFLPDPADLPQAGEWERNKLLIAACESPAVKKLIDGLWVPAPPGLRAQWEVEAGGNRYRLDFAIPEKKIAIEVDGHEFHSTKEQRTKDAVRDRNLQLEGWRVFRFTGSEIYANPRVAAGALLRICEVVL